PFARVHVEGARLSTSDQVQAIEPWLDALHAHLDGREGVQGRRPRRSAPQRRLLSTAHEEKAAAEPLRERNALELFVARHEIRGDEDASFGETLRAQPGAERAGLRRSPRFGRKNPRRLRKTA